MSGRNVVLLYHRIADEESTRSGCASRPCTSRSSSRCFRRLADVVPASGISTAPPGSVAITFDDGYADVIAESVPAAH